MNEKKLEAFAVDDDPGELELLQRHLEQLPNLEVELHPYTDPNLAIIEFLNHGADLIFLDYQLGELTAIDVLEQIRRIGDLRPAIVLTGHGDEYAAAELTRSGADDYIVKADLSVDILRSAITRALAAYGKRLSEAEVVKHAFELERANERLERSKSELEKMNAQLKELSDTDSLTGVSNHRCFVEQATKELARCERNAAPVSLALVNVDGFAQVLDRHGRAVGDQLLTRVAHRLQGTVRQYDLVARLDGDTFGILFPEADLQDAATVTDRCRQAMLGISLPLESTGATIGVTISAGIACNAIEATTDLDTLMKLAEAALHRAKESSGNQVVTQEAQG